jgi:hypothetical protein
LLYVTTFFSHCLFCLQSSEATFWIALIYIHKSPFHSHSIIPNYFFHVSFISSNSIYKCLWNWLFTSLCSYKWLFKSLFLSSKGTITFIVIIFHHQTWIICCSVLSLVHHSVFTFIYWQGISILTVDAPFSTQELLFSIFLRQPKFLCSVSEFGAHSQSYKVPIKFASPSICMSETVQEPPDGFALNFR